MAETTAGRLRKTIAVVLLLSSLDFQLVSCNLCRCFFDQCYICDEDRIEEAMNCLCVGNCGEEDEEKGSGEEDEEDCPPMDDRGCTCSATELFQRCSGDEDTCRENVLGCLPTQNAQRCIQNVLGSFCKEADSCENDTTLSTVIVIVISICITVTILVAMAVCAVILALYWKFKIKLIRETRNVNPSQARVSEDPLYSVLDSQLPPGYTEPPQLPPTRVPYYEEIESDRIGAAAKAPHDIPLTSLSPKQGKDNYKDEAAEPYQEPIDARK